MHPSHVVLAHLVHLLAASGTPASSTSPASKGGSSGYSGILLIVVIVAAVYFLMIRPQRNRAKAAVQTRSEIEPGKEVMTRHGQFGRVVSVDDDAVTLEIAPGVHSRFVKEAIAKVVTPPEPEAPSEPPGIESIPEQTDAEDNG